MSASFTFRGWVLVAIVLVASWAPRTSTAGIIALNPQDHLSFYLHGLVRVDVGDGSVHVNSSSYRAAFFQGTGVKLTAGAVNLVGQYETGGRPLLSTPIHTEQPAVPDPLAWLPAPEAGPPVGPPTITGTGTFQPGYYPQGLHLAEGNDVTLTPGVYVLDNGFQIDGAATLRGQGVMFYIRSGAIADQGTGTRFLAPPAEGIYRGVTFFQARDNTNLALFSNAATFTGVGDAAGIGTLYLPAATLEMGGSGDMYVNGIIADKVVAYGTGLKAVIVPEPSVVGLLAVAGAALMGRTRGQRRLW